ncbi:mucin-5AC-like, partial [Tachysurus ichikawai]
QSTGLGYSHLARPASCLPYSSFIDALQSTFYHNIGALTSSPLRIHQGTRSVSSYTIDFQIVAAGSGYNGQALQEAYVQGLFEELKDELAVCNSPQDLEALYQLAKRIDNRLWACKTERQASFLRTHVTGSMGLHQHNGPFHSETPRSLPRGPCHSKQVVKLQGLSQVKGPGLVQDVTPHSSGLFLSAILLLGGSRPINLWVFVDSEAARNFIDKGLARSLKLRLEALPQPLPVHALDRSPLAAGPITMQTDQLTLSIGLVTLCHSGIVAHSGLEEAVRQALRQEPDPGGGPSNRLYVTTLVRPQVLAWGKLHLQQGT